MSEIVGQLDLGYSSDLAAFRRFTRSSNKQLLRDFDDPENRRELMRLLIQIDPKDAFTYQHAAMMELDQDNVDAASKHLNKAIALRPGDPSIRDTEGRLALTVAIAEPNPVIADDAFARVEQLFKRNISRRRDEPFGYRHLAETYVHWSRRHPEIEKRLRYLELAYQTLLEGLEKCSSGAMLLQYQAE